MSRADWIVTLAHVLIGLPVAIMLSVSLWRYARELDGYARELDAWRKESSELESRLSCRCPSCTPNTESAPGGERKA